MQLSKKKLQKMKWFMHLLYLILRQHTNIITLYQALCRHHQTRQTMLNRPFVAQHFQCLNQYNLQSSNPQLCFIQCLI